MSGDNKQNDIVQRLNSAAAEAEALKSKLKQADSESYDIIANCIAANYQLIMDEANQEMKDEYEANGRDLTGARLCEINSSRDSYSISVQDVLDLIKELKKDE